MIYSRGLRKGFSVFMIFLLALTLVLPQHAGAKPVQKISEEDEKALEIEKELEVKNEQKSEKSTDLSNRKKDADNGTIPSLADGIELTDEPAKNEADFVMDGKVEADILHELDSNETANIIIRLKKSVDMTKLSNTLSSLKNKEDKAEKVVAELQSVAESTQGKLLKQLTALKDSKKVSNIQQFWVFNGVSATVTKDALKQLAKSKDVEKITLDAEIQAPEFEPEENPPRLPEWGLEKIFAPKVWDKYGVKGKGIVVGIMDTGVQGDHEALRNNYRGRYGEGKYSWIDVSGQGYTTPQDGQGHGTHVAGTAVGGGDGEPIGVAPDAEWIAAKIFDDGGRATTSGIHAAFEWFLAPGGDPDKAPDVVNNSWGNSSTYQTEFLEDIDAWVAAGIFPLFAAGNDGPGPQTVGSPGSFSEVFSIGATDKYDQIASFSSRGPVFWPDENGENVRYVKPEVSAPGHEIYSSLPNGGYGTKSGTSMATPHVAGAIALILQSNPGLTIKEVANLLEDTARTEKHMDTLPNDNYGYGIVNVYQAVTEASYSGEINGTLKDNDGNPIPGELYFPKEQLRIQIEKDGKFKFNIREGEQEVNITSFGFQTKTDSIDVKKGEKHEANWMLEKSDRFNVTGTVSYENGDPVAYGYVRVKDTPISTIRTDENGTYTIPDIPEDDYKIVISGQAIKQKTETVTVNKNTKLNITVKSVTVNAQSEWSTSKNNYNRNAITAAEIDPEKLISSWEFITPGQVLFSSPVIAEGKVVFTTDRGYIVVLDQKTGKEIWSLGTGNSNRSTPTVVDGVVYVAGGGDYSIHAIDLETGMKKWSTKLDYPAVYESPIYQNGVLYISSYMDKNAKVVALNAKSGKKIWEKEVGNGAYFGAALGEGQLFAGTYDSKQLKALSVTDGEEQWEVTMKNEGFAASPVYEDGVVYAATTNFNSGSGTLRAFDATNGKELWNDSTIGNTESGAPIIFDDLVIIGSAAKPVMKAFNKYNGELVWETDNGSAMVNSGAVSGNGNLYVSDLSSKLKVYDVFSGELLYTYSLSNSSTSSVALTEGQVVVADTSSIFSFAAPGILSGKISDDQGNPVKAKVTIQETGEFAETDEQGNYVFKARPGEYEVKVTAYGYKQIKDEHIFTSGYKIKKDYQLEAAKTGSFSGQVVDKDTGNPLENVSIAVIDTSNESKTDSSGKFSFTDVYEGTYDVSFSIAGFEKEVLPVTVTPGKDREIEIKMSPVAVAVVDDYEGEVVRFLNNNNISAEEHGWDIVEDIGSFKVLYLNGAYTSGGPKPTEEQFKKLIKVAKENDVSVLFADTWGPNYGSLRTLWEFTNDPPQYGSDTSLNKTVQLRVDEEHPILEGLDKNSTHTILNKGYLAWFNQYSGRHLASVGTSTDGILGSGVAYKGVTEDSAHLLLSTQAASPWVSPYTGWTSVQQQILLNGVNYLLEDATFGKLSGSITDMEGNPIDNVSIEVVDTGVTAKSDKELGTYELFHDEGTYKVAFIKTGYTTQELDVQFKKGKPVAEDVVMGTSDSGTISGKITNKVTGQEVPYAEIHLYDKDDHLVAEEVGSQNGSYEISGLDEATYRLEVVLRDYVTYTETIKVAADPISFNIDLYPAPDVAIIGDYSFGSIREMLGDKGIDSKNYAGIDDVFPELPNLDVVFFNEQSTFTITKKSLEKFLNEADKYEVSVIFGDDYYSGSGIAHLVNHFKDPETRTQHRDKTRSAGYVVKEENPIFGDAKPGDFIDILVPDASSIISFEGYSGYSLADIKHEGDEDVYGTGVAFKPRTGGSVELLMSGHGTSVGHDGRDYTQNGIDMFVNAILWSAYIKYNVIEGFVTDEDGNPLYANVKVKDEAGLSAWTDPKTGHFSIGSLDGGKEIEINSFAFQTNTQTVVVDKDLEPLHIQMKLQENIGSIKGTFADENTHVGIDGVHIEVVGQPREATTDKNGEFEIEHLVPGTYTLIAEKDGYVLQNFNVKMKENETINLERKMKPSPTIAVIVDSQSSSAFSLADYLTPRGYIVEEIYYTDIDRIGDFDLIFANSDYNNSKIPEKEDFINFTKELDRTETPIIWAGNGGPSGSIRFLVDYIGDPAVEHMGSLPSSNRTMTASKLEDHPILEDVKFDESGEFTFDNNYYNGFEGYTGTTIAEVSHEEKGEFGSLVAYGGRTVNSAEVLLSTMAFGYGFSEEKYFDKNREKIINNAITWALDNKDPLVGEVHGKVKNNLDREVFSTVTVEETGYTIDTEQDGSFFLGLDDGTYTLTIDAFGHQSESYEITIERGQQLKETYLLTTEDAGVIKGEIKGEDTNEGIDGATVQLVETPVKATTDAKGNYEMQAPAGEYRVRVTANGYTPKVVTVKVDKNKETALNVTLTVSEKIAFVGTSINGDRATPFIEKQGYEVDFWLNSKVNELMDQLDEYSLVILNDRDSSSMPEATFKEFVDLADSLGVSIIFTSQWNNGTIRDLTSFYNDPESVKSDFEPNFINYKVIEEHPIFSGFDVGDEIRILEREKSNQQYSAFESYSGTTIADITHDEKGRLGGGIAYDFRTSNNVHVLLGSLHVGSYGYPEDRWTEDAKKIYINTIDWALSAKQGEIKGTVLDKEGKAISEAAVSIPAQSLKTKTNSEGAYVIGVGLGEHEVKVQAHGYAPQAKTVEVKELGQSAELNFELEKTDRMTVSGYITDMKDKGIEKAKVTLTEASSKYEKVIKTDTDGFYQFDELVAGEYDMLLEANGYQSVSKKVTVKEGKNVELNLKLSEFDIAILGDSKDKLTDFLEENNLAAQSRDWDIVDDVYNYKAIVVNTNKGTVDQIEKLIDEADKYETSLIFVDTWGGDGSIQLLEEAVGSPVRAEQGYNQGAIFVKVQEPHEIFSDFAEDKIKVHSEKSPFATFKDYEGITLANLEVDGEDKGATIAYNFRGENHMHLLLSSYAVNNMIGPNQGWTSHGKQLFLQALEWAKDGKQGLPSIPEWTVEDNIITNGSFELTGKADYTSTVSILHNEKELAAVLPDKDNTFHVEISDLEQGEYELTLQASNFAGQVTSEETVTVIVDNESPKLDVISPAGHIVVGNKLIEVKGTVTDVNFDRLLVNNEEVKVKKDQFTTQVILEEGTNTIVVVAYDLAGNKTVIERQVTVSLGAPEISELKPSTDQYVLPGEKVEISFHSKAEGGKASFMIKLPIVNSTKSIDNAMEEVKPGVYQGVWTVPAGVDLQGAIVEVKFADAAGNKVTQEAEGKLFISSGKLDRIAGDLRYDTAIGISQKGWAKSDTVVIARGDEFADALAGVPYAYQIDAPILLTPNNKLYKETLKELQRLGVKKAVILGGPVAINESVSKELEKAGLKVDRIAGDNRFDTAALIAAKVAPKGSSEIAVANGMDFPDALSVASHAAKKGMPILLTQADKLPKATTEAIKDLKAKETIVVGGPLVVEDKVVKQLPKAERLSGNDRYDTNIEVTKHFGVNSKHMYIATGKLYADALTGAVLAAKNDSAIVLVHNKVPKDTGKYLTVQQVKHLTIFGGTVAVDKEVEHALEQLIK